MWREAVGEPTDPTPESVLDLPPAATPLQRVASKPRTVPKIVAPVALDPHDAKAIRRGRVTIDARVDLHGMTQARAFEALSRFVQRGAAQGLRCVLVITGKGARRPDEDDPYAGFGAGVLRTQLPHWLESPQLAPLVISSGPAAPQHGGDGARYVLLRRRRPRSP